MGGVSRREGAAQTERERGACPGDRKTRPSDGLAGGRGEAEKSVEEQRDRTTLGSVSLIQDIALYLRTKGELWQSLK